MSNGIEGIARENYRNKNVYSADPQCQFGVSVARQLRVIWACLTAIFLLIAVQIAMTTGAMQRADEAVDASNDRKVNVARLEERLTAIQTTLSRMEARLMERIKISEDN